MNYHLAACDDDGAALMLVEKYIREWGMHGGHTVQVDCFPSAEAFLFRYSEDKTYDILLLDIEMGGINGVELAKLVREGNREIQIVFITGYSDYIADGYEVDALHYLMKPVDGGKLSAVLDRAADKLRRNERALLLEQGGETVRIPFYEIAYLEVVKNYVTIHANETYTVKKSLSELMLQLDGRFYRSGRSHIINLYFVDKITKTEIHLKNDAVIPLPRGMYDDINRALIRYF